MRPINRTHATAWAVLAAIVTYYVDADNDVPASNRLPERRQVTAGPPAWDCEGITVWTENTGSHGGDIVRGGPTALVADAGAMLRYLQLGITIARCSTQVIETAGNQLVWPTAEEEIATAEVVHFDEVIVPNAIFAASEGGVLLPGANDWAIMDWKVVGPMGGYVASEHRIRIATDWPAPEPADLPTYPPDED